MTLGIPSESNSTTDHSKTAMGDASMHGILATNMSPANVGLRNSSVARFTGIATPRGAAPPAEAGVVPKLTIEGYTTRPSLEALEQYSEMALSAVQDFAVIHEIHGEICWPGFTDVRGMNLDWVISIEERSVEVYGPTYTKNSGPAPEVGKALNKPAFVTLHNCFPKPRRGTPPDTGQNFEEIYQKHERRVQKQTTSMGAKFLSLSRSWTWKFKVEHFSRYALEEDGKYIAGSTLHFNYSQDATSLKEHIHHSMNAKAGGGGVLSDSTDMLATAAELVCGRSSPFAQTDFFDDGGSSLLYMPEPLKNESNSTVHDNLHQHRGVANNPKSYSYFDISSSQPVPFTGHQSSEQHTPYLLRFAAKPTGDVLNRTPSTAPFSTTTLAHEVPPTNMTLVAPETARFKDSGTTKTRRRLASTVDSAAQAASTFVTEVQPEHGVVSAEHSRATKRSDRRKSSGKHDANQTSTMYVDSTTHSEAQRPSVTTPAWSSSARSKQRRGVSARTVLAFAPNPISAQLSGNLILLSTTKIQTATGNLGGTQADLDSLSVSALKLSAVSQNRMACVKSKNWSEVSTVQDTLRCYWVEMLELMWDLEMNILPLDSAGFDRLLMRQTRLAADRYKVVQGFVEEFTNSTKEAGTTQSIMRRAAARMQYIEETWRLASALMSSFVFSNDTRRRASHQDALYDIVSNDMFWHAFMSRQILRRVNTWLRRVNARHVRRLLLKKLSDSFSKATLGEDTLFEEVTLLMSAGMLESVAEALCPTKLTAPSLNASATNATSVAHESDHLQYPHLLICALGNATPTLESSPLRRETFQRQLLAWKSEGLLKYVSPHMKSVMNLLGGVVGPIISKCASLDWRCALALILWFAPQLPPPEANRVAAHHRISAAMNSKRQPQVISGYTVRQQQSEDRVNLLRQESSSVSARIAPQLKQVDNSKIDTLWLQGPNIQPSGSFELRRRSNPSVVPLPYVVPAINSALESFESLSDVPSGSLSESQHHHNTRFTVCQEKDLQYKLLAMFSGKRSFELKHLASANDHYWALDNSLNWALMRTVAWFRSYHLSALGVKQHRHRHNNSMESPMSSARSEDSSSTADVDVSPTSTAEDFQIRNTSFLNTTSSLVNSGDGATSSNSAGAADDSLNMDACALTLHRASVGFSEQLTVHGLYHWAIFVWLTGRRNTLRKSTFAIAKVRELVGQHVGGPVFAVKDVIGGANIKLGYMTLPQLSVLANAAYQSKFLISRIGVPLQWIRFAQAEQCEHASMLLEACSLYIEAAWLSGLSGDDANDTTASTTDDLHAGSSTSASLRKSQYQDRATEGIHDAADLLPSDQTVFSQYVTSEERRIFSPTIQKCYERAIATMMRPELLPSRILVLCKVMLNGTWREGVFSQGLADPATAFRLDDVSLATFLGGADVPAPSSPVSAAGSESGLLKGGNTTKRSHHALTGECLFSLAELTSNENPVQSLAAPSPYENSKLQRHSHKDSKGEEMSFETIVEELGLGLYFLPEGEVLCDLLSKLSTAQDFVDDSPELVLCTVCAGFIFWLCDICGWPEDPTHDSLADDVTVSGGGVSEQRLSSAHGSSTRGWRGPSLSPQRSFKRTMRRFSDLQGLSSYSSKWREGGCGGSSDAPGASCFDTSRVKEAQRLLLSIEKQRLVTSLSSDLPQSVAACEVGKDLLEGGMAAVIGPANSSAMCDPTTDKKILAAVLEAMHHALSAYCIMASEFQCSTRM